MPVVSVAAASAQIARSARLAGASAHTNVPAPTPFPESPMTTKTLTTNDVTSARAAMARRPRRLRRSEGIRTLVRETVVHPEDLIYPLFVVPQSRQTAPIGSMP